MTAKGIYFSLYLPWMMFVVKEDEALNPAKIGLFGVKAKVHKLQKRISLSNLDYLSDVVLILEPPI